MNFVSISGRLAQNPKSYVIDEGKTVSRFTVAVNRYYAGEELTDFIPVSAWGKLGDTCKENLYQGRKVLVEGRISIRSYTTKTGKKNRLAEIVASRVVYLDYKKNSPADYAAEFGEEIGEAEYFAGRK